MSEVGGNIQSMVVVEFTVGGWVTTGQVLSEHSRRTPILFLAKRRGSKAQEQGYDSVSRRARITEPSFSSNR